MTSKTNPGNFFEDFRLGQVIRHATPRTVDGGDVALYTALYGAALRRAVVGRVRASDRLSRARRSTTCSCSTSCSARRCRTSRSTPSPTSATPTCRFLQARLSRRHAVGGVRGDRPARELQQARPASSTCAPPAATSTASAVLDYVRWVMVRKRDEAAPAPSRRVPKLPERVDAGRPRRAPCRASTSPTTTSRWPAARYRWGDYAVGEKIDHVDGMTIEEAEHQIATRLYQNTAKVHFNQHSAGAGPVRAAADLRRPRHLAGPRAVVQRPRQRLPRRRHQRRPPRRAAASPATRSTPGARCWRRPVAGRNDIGALRMRTVATKNRPATTFP